MTTWKLEDPLEEFSIDEQIALKDAAIAYLRENLLDDIGCAKHLGMDTLTYLSLKGFFSAEFEEIRILVVSQCEKYIADVGTGKIAGDEVNKERLTTSKWIVERKSNEWIKTTRAVTKNEGQPEPTQPNGKGAELLKKLGNKNGNASVRTNGLKH